MSAPLPREIQPILLGPKEVCKVLGVSMSVLYGRLRKEPAFPQPVYIGDRPKWSVAALEEWVSKRAGSSESPASTATGRR